MAEIDYLLKQAEAFHDLGKYKEITDLLPDSLLPALESDALYVWRAYAYDKLGDPARAIADYTTAIGLKNDNALAHFNRGILWGNKGEPDNAIEDYTESIKLEGGDPPAFYNRGNAWYAKRELANAIADYTLAINLRNDYEDAYYNRGYVRIENGDYEGAVADFAKIIELNPKDSSAYVGRGVASEKLNNFEAAIDDYNKAIELDPKNSEAILLRDTFYKIKEYIKDLPENEQKALMFFYKQEIYPIIENIRKQAAQIDSIWKDPNDTKHLAHYSSLKVADIFIMNDEKKMRYSNAVFMNDPDEGKILIDRITYLERNDANPGEITAAFSNILKEEKCNFYIGSFLPMIDGHEDELLMWRTYGKDENQKEAAGCCLLIDINFFDKGDGGNIALGKVAGGNMMPGKGKISTPAQPLYKVLYYNQRTNKFVGENREEVDKCVSDLKDALKKLLGKKSEPSAVSAEVRAKAIDRVLYHTLSELRYFFKSSDYVYENELRVIQFATDPEIVKIDDTGNMLPRKIFIESTREIRSSLRKIVLGPMVTHHERWMYLEKQMNDKGYSFPMISSICRFQ